MNHHKDLPVFFASLSKDTSLTGINAISKFDESEQTEDKGTTLPLESSQLLRKEYINLIAYSDQMGNRKYIFS